jgi:hypothetical protein
MRTLLDLIQEFAILNDAKTLADGILPPDQEERWAELKVFYDLLMAQDGLCENPASRFSAEDIRRTVTCRRRLRVRTDMEIVVELNSDVHSVRVGNLSCGGVLLLGDASLEAGSPLTLYLVNLSRGESILPASGEVVWIADRGETTETYRYRMGIRFVSIDESALTSLDSFVVDSLENQLLSLDRGRLDPQFLDREQIRL